MRQGVHDSDVFLLILSNSVLSRKFCRKEITWALEFGKPIIMLQMSDDRFWPWDYQRWTDDRCAKVPNTSPPQWEAGWLQSHFMACERSIKRLVERHYREQKMIAFRRRDFEANAMVREVLSRAGESSVWGRLPPSTARHDAQVSARRTVFVVCEPATGSGACSELLKSLSRESPAIRISTIANSGQQMDQLLEAASHVLILLTKGAGAPNSVSLRQLQAAAHSSKPLLFAYLDRTETCPSGWSFQDNNAAEEVKALLGSNEAMVYRAADSAYEHTSMVLEMLRRMKVDGGSFVAGAPSAKKGSVAVVPAAAARKRTTFKAGEMPPRRTVALRPAAARPVAAATATANPIASNRVVDGMDVEMAEFPFQRLVTT